MILSITDNGFTDLVVYLASKEKTSFKDILDQVSEYAKYTEPAWLKEVNEYGLFHTIIELEILGLAAEKVLHFEKTNKSLDKALEPFIGKDNPYEELIKNKYHIDGDDILTGDVEVRIDRDRVIELLHSENRPVIH